MANAATRTQPHCPSCGWPAAAPNATHRSSQGSVGYQRCVCGRWLVLVDGRVVGGAGRSEFCA
ncbi:hypothetical protein F0L68_03895 [Solihabitans fulvus]|uniref:Uncharacterized protein n=1 Tax=Solihabitans fulvus TaxID=1892852 RepID=A0A5B2XPI6_9PSEU|nr:hypothetical protein F0L68_03895 [Solihabitans fulvus]